MQVWKYLLDSYYSLIECVNSQHKGSQCVIIPPLISMNNGKDCYKIKDKMLHCYFRDRIKSCERFPLLNRFKTAGLPPPVLNLNFLTLRSYNSQKSLALTLVGNLRL